MHADRVRLFGNDGADTAKAEQQQRLRVHPVDGGVDRVCAPFSGADVRGERDQPLVAVQNRRQNIIRQIFRAVAVHICHGNTELPRRFHIHIVVSAAENGNAAAALEPAQHRFRDGIADLRQEQVGILSECLQVL